MNKIITIISICILMVGCSPTIPEATPMLENPETPISTTTIEPTITATPEPTPTPVPTPPVPHGLRSENAATQVYENGVWTVKNADGQITATWNKGTSEWTYDMETIKIQQILEDGDPFFPPKELAADILARPLPPDDLLTHFIDPKTNKPLGYGTFSEETRLVNDRWIGEYILPVTYISVRVRGCYVNEYGNPFILVSHLNGPDSESIVSFYIDDPYQLSVLGLSNQDLTGNLTEYIKNYRQLVPKESICSFLNGEAFGKQALIQAKHDMPVGAMNRMEEFYRESNKGADEAIAFLNGSRNPPVIKYTSDDFQYVFSSILIFPQAESGPILIN